ncbi:hypothetical protein TRKP067_5023 [Klebsiella pneumoniae]|uniref:Uncharacterized protein n=1 Tax=Klebsiella pneumoniae TaxID=573 RepID=A0A3T0VB19_KLEPN|nr:hypothetical protein [Klebsiella pneumoniae]QAR16907.1 hypothetical protein [Klebsiella pneumoniae]QEQ70311.1 hypothetical protein [Klebsiella pneumoniae]QJX12454.1 hypothetical protein [Klebsiella pneumoniae]QVQ57348.1 hypothetical protein [Klebsiella pneumoniae]
MEDTQERTVFSFLQVNIVRTKYFLLQSKCGISLTKHLYVEK